MLTLGEEPLSILCRSYPPGKALCGVRYHMCRLTKYSISVIAFVQDLSHGNLGTWAECLSEDVLIKMVAKIHC